MNIPVSFILHITLALLLGVAIGLERLLTGHPVSIKTTALVAFGACLFGLYAEIFGGVPETRVAAQVVTGVGFICTAVIYKDDHVMHGLNSAATIWVTAGIGLLCSTPFYSYAISAAAILIIFNLLFSFIDDALKKRALKDINMTPSDQSDGRLV